MEQIEARLAAYIDGVLPADQRAEIEQYLAANPSHAQLISELKSIKAAVTALPREKAPPEVLDTLQAHLERQTLLEGVEETAGTSRINRWPQLGAVAAMLLLTGGLGLLVYQVLPRGQSGATDLALLPETTRPTASDSELNGGPVTLDLPATRKAEPDGAMVRDKSAAKERSIATVEKSVRDVRTEASAIPAAKVATLPSSMLLSQATIAPAGPVPTAVAGSNDIDRFVFNPPTTVPFDAGVSPTEDVVLETPDPRMTRNLVAATLAAMGRRVAANDTPTTRPTTRSTDVIVAAAAMPADREQINTPAKDGASDDISLIARGVTDAELVQLESAAGLPRPAMLPATTHVMTTQAAAPEVSTPATRPARDVRLIFRAVAAPATSPATAPTTRETP